MSLIEVKVPDIGDFSDVPVIELFVKVGDTIKVDDAIATLESDKATMDVPSSAAGVIKEVEGFRIGIRPRNLRPGIPDDEPGNKPGIAGTHPRRV